MTALSRYRKLECTGLWRETAGAQRREVFVALGEATLVITDAAGRVLSAWSLAAIEPVAAGPGPLRFRPGGESGEEIEIADPDMIEALERVNRAIARGRRRRARRLRRWALPGVAVALVAVLALWLPGALRDYAARGLPDSLRARLGADLADAMAAASDGRVCRPAGRGARALAAFARAVEVTPGRLAVIPGAGPAAWALPGGHVVLGGALLAKDRPGRALTAVRAAQRGVGAGAPLAALLRHLGTAGTLRLLAAGEVAPAALGDHAQRLLETPPPAPPVAAGATTIDDRHWLALRAACGG